jgi:hypothetical protein
LARQEGKGSVLPPGTPPSKPQAGAGRGLIVKSNDSYVFTNLSYQGRVLPAVALGSKLLDNGATKTQAEWFVFSRQNSGGWSAVDAEILYQCLFRAYGLRNDEKYKGIVQEITRIFQTAFDPKAPALNTLTKVVYGSGLDAVVSRLGRFPGLSQDARLQIPEFTRFDDYWSYFVLADEQQESKLGTMNLLPLNASLVLKELLGKSYERAGAVFQYFSPRKDGKLREARLWTPTSTNRNQEWVVALSVGSLGDWFSLSAKGLIGYLRPAFGVREQKISTGSEGGVV